MRHALALPILISAGAAGACEIWDNPRAYREDKPACGVMWHEKGALYRSLGSAEDLGQGRVVQSYDEGTACGYEESTILIDCAADRAVVFGAGSGGFDPGPADAGDKAYARLAGQVKKNPMLALDEISRRAKAGGLINTAVIPVAGMQVGLSNSEEAPKRRFDLSCGCKLYYPGSPGAGG